MKRYFTDGRSNIKMVFPKFIRQPIQKIVNKMGYNIEPLTTYGFFPGEEEIIKYVKPYTLTPFTSIKSLIEATKYIIKNDISGSFIECGVWQGGSIMTIIKTLQELKIQDREIYLFDTFEGMSQPTKNDTTLTGETASENIQNIVDLTTVSLNNVKKNILDTGYDESLIHFVKGKVEETLPKTIIKEIALLRLDTDWYESTKCELEHLFPKLSNNGVIIIDDYDAWIGSRKAMDEYIKNNNIPILLHRIHPSGARIGIKQQSTENKL